MQPGQSPALHLSIEEKRHESHENPGPRGCRGRSGQRHRRRHAAAPAQSARRAGFGPEPSQRRAAGRSVRQQHGRRIGRKPERHAGPGAGRPDRGRTALWRTRLAGGLGRAWRASGQPDQQDRLRRRRRRAWRDSGTTGGRHQDPQRRNRRRAGRSAGRASGGCRGGRHGGPACPQGFPAHQRRQLWRAVQRRRGQAGRTRRGPDPRTERGGGADAARHDPGRQIRRQDRRCGKAAPAGQAGRRSGRRGTAVHPRPDGRPRGCRGAGPRRAQGAGIAGLPDVAAGHRPGSRGRGPLSGPAGAGPEAGPPLGRRDP